jgi:hypothetical protein
MVLGGVDPSVGEISFESGEVDTTFRVGVEMEGVVSLRGGVFVGTVPDGVLPLVMLPVILVV